MKSYAHHQMRHPVRIRMVYWKLIFRLDLTEILKIQCHRTNTSEKTSPDIYSYFFTLFAITHWNKVRFSPQRENNYSKKRYKFDAKRLIPSRDIDVPKLKMSPDKMCGKATFCTFHQSFFSRGRL